VATAEAEAEMTESEPAAEMVMQITIQNRNGLVLDTRQISFADLPIAPTDADFPLGITIDVVELAASHNFVVMHPPARRAVPEPPETSHPPSWQAHEVEVDMVTGAVSTDMVSAYPPADDHNPPFTPATPDELTRPYTGDMEPLAPGTAVAGGPTVKRGFWEPLPRTARS